MIGIVIFGLVTAGAGILLMLCISTDHDGVLLFIAVVLVAGGIALILGVAVENSITVNKTCMQQQTRPHHHNKSMNRDTFDHEAL